LKEQNAQLRTENESLRESVGALTDSMKQLKEQLEKGAKRPIVEQVEVKEEHYPEQQLRINVVVKHGEDSFVLNKEEAAELVREVTELRTKLEDLGEGEVIPFLDYA